MKAATVTLPALLSPRQLAEYLDVPVDTIYDWHAKGTGPKRSKVGKHIRYRTTDVDAWLEQRVS